MIPISTFDDTDPESLEAPLPLPIGRTFTRHFVSTARRLNRKFETLQSNINSIEGNVAIPIS